MTHRQVDLAALHRFGFLTVAGYSMIAFSNALEVCRMANYLCRKPVYSWRVMTVDGAPAPASNGLSLEPTSALSDAEAMDVLFVCGGVDVRHAVDRRLKDALRRAARSGIALGALCTGSFALAEAGLLEGYRCAIHWENLAAIREEFAKVTFVEDLFVIDRDRLTCTGGVAPLDMMLVLIEARLGAALATQVSDQFIVERIRQAGDRQTGSRRGPGGIHPMLRRAVRIMQANIEAPLAIDAVADSVGISRRQLERQFRDHLGQRPAAFYAALRLDRARELLRLTAMPITEIAVACGFQSASHFSTTYAGRFGHAPRSERTAGRRGAMPSRQTTTQPC
jgi:AraC family transcriptional regulator, glycine betaine-responsive activator